MKSLKVLVVVVGNLRLVSHVPLGQVLWVKLIGNIRPHELVGL